MKRIFNIFICLAVALSSSAQVVLSNSEARAMAQQNSREMRIAANNSLQSQCDIAIAKGARLPSLSAQAALMYMFNEVDMQGTTLKMKPFYEFGASLQWPIYAGGKITAAVHEAKLGLEMRRLSEDMTQAEVVAAADKAYWQYVSVHEKVKLLGQYKSLLDTLYAQTNAAYMAQLGIKSDLLAVASKQKEIEYNLSKVKNGEEIAKMYLCYTLGLPLDTAIVATDSIVSVSQSEVENLDTDLSSRPEYQLLGKQAELAKEEVKMQRGEYLPTFALSASFLRMGGVKMGGVTQVYVDPMTGAMSDPMSGRVPVDYEYESEFKGNYGTAMAVLSIPIYHFGEGFKKVKKAKIEAENAQLEMEEKRELLNIEVQSAVRNLINAYNMIGTAQTALEYAQENLNVTKSCYDVKLRSMTDLLQAQIQWQESYSNLIDAGTNFKICQSAYLKAVGKLK